jgi:single-stranded-DNA-specific exonuclease
MLTKKWTIKHADEIKSKKLQEELNIKHYKICEILTQRGIDTLHDAEQFFNPNLKDLHDPFLMKDMDKAVDRIVEAIQNNEKILIYGDYDVDGTTSVALMCLFLRKINVPLEFYIPDRYSEGYGISNKGIEYARDNDFKLIISLDCGVTAIAQVDLANQFGIDFIICDHHLPSEELPKALAILDAKRVDCNYPFKELSGCGVGFKLCQALSITLDLPSEFYLDLLDLVAVSIASDIVPIVGENRILAFHGLKKLNNNPCVGLMSLIDWAGLGDKEMSISDIVFSLGPRINAPGRMTHAKASVEILVSNDVKIGKDMASKLNEVNLERRSTDEIITGEAISAIDNQLNFENKKTIVLTNKDWHKGVIGIVASRLVEKYYRPTIIFAEKDDVLTGSARSIKGFSIYQGIKGCEHLVNQFGGHDFAAGVSIPKENFEKFVSAFEEEANKSITEDMLQPEIEIDTHLQIDDINPKFYDILKRIGPFGPLNMQPVFMTKNLQDAGGTKIVGKNHIRFHLKDEFGKQINGICFGLADYYDIADIKRNKINICYTLQENIFNGRTTIDFMIKDIKIID